MANHGFVFTRKKLSKDRLQEALQKVNQDRFKGRMEIERDGDWNPGKPLFKIKLTDDIHIFFWLSTPHKVEHRHGPGGDFRWWVESVFANDLALTWDGWLGDEGVPERWKPEQDKFPTLRSYMKAMYKWHRKDKKETLAHKLAARRMTNMFLKEARVQRPDLKEYFK